MQDNIIYSKRSNFVKGLKHTLSIPFIYGFIIPIIILDIAIFIYQHTAFRLYGIPFVKWSDYVTFERNKVTFLNFIDKFHCVYCSYVNGVLAYAIEVCARTEKYWCPIKRSVKSKTHHDWEQYFADKDNAEAFFEQFKSNKEFFNEKYTTDVNMHEGRACTEHIDSVIKENK